MLALIIVAPLLGVAVYHHFKPLPDGLSFRGAERAATDVEVLIDDTWVDAAGKRHVQQEIFDEVIDIIGRAESLVLIDMFLFNDFQGPVPETERALSGELTAALVEKRAAAPEVEVILITDPVNELYGSLEAPHLERLRESGVRVVTTRLDVLRDSNPAYSTPWRLLAKPFGNGPGSLVPNPIGSGRISMRSFLELVNFRANHRKVLVADPDGRWTGLVSSANPHDGSSAHRNLALRFGGPAVADLLATENAVLALSDAATVNVEITTPAAESELSLRVVTELEIKNAAIDMIDGAEAYDAIELYMFYLSERDIIAALKRASARGVFVRVLLDPNKDAFGREKNGVPNRPVGYELNDADVEVRWCHTLGEQCHAKTLMLRSARGRAQMLTGSANFTRRNLDDYNLESDVLLAGPSDAAPFERAVAWFDASWDNADDQSRSLDFEVWETASVWKRALYRFTEFSGLSTY